MAVPLAVPNWTDTGPVLPLVRTTVITALPTLSRTSKRLVEKPSAPGK